MSNQYYPSKLAFLLAAFIFLDGCQSKKDDLTRRAEQGDAEAQYALGGSLRGIGLLTSDKNKLKWLRRAAEQGYVEAQYDLGKSGARWRWVATIDRQEADMWLRSAAEQGHIEAQYDLARKYGEGKEVHRDYQQAAKWYQMAAEYTRLPGESRTNEIAFTIAANRSAATLGSMYETGQGVPYNPQKALKWTRKAATEGHAPAQFTLGNKYARGQDVTQDHQQAARWYARAAEKGHAGAYFALGVMYDNGHGVPQDFVKSYAWMNLAAARGDKNELVVIRIQSDRLR